MTSILDERELTDAERVAIADEPRPGVWLQEMAMTPDRGPVPVSAIKQPAHEIEVQCDWRGDGRELSQEYTDIAIASEVWAGLDLDGRTMMAEVVTQIVSGHPIRQRGEDFKPPFSQQRGGIHSEPLVRLLAFRAWGDRDRMWRKRDTVRALVRGRGGDLTERFRLAYGFDGVTIEPIGMRGGVEYTAFRGGRQAVTELLTREMEAATAGEEAFEMFLNVFDQLDAKLAAGGDPLPSGLLTFDIDARR